MTETTSTARPADGPAPDPWAGLPGPSANITRLAATVAATDQAIAARHANTAAGGPGRLDYGPGTADDDGPAPVCHGCGHRQTIAPGAPAGTAAACWRSVCAAYGRPPTFTPLTDRELAEWGHRAGRRAAANGQPAAANPFRAGTIAAAGFARGYNNDGPGGGGPGSGPANAPAPPAGDIPNSPDNSTEPQPAPAAKPDLAGRAVSGTAIVVAAGTEWSHPGGPVCAAAAHNGYQAGAANDHRQQPPRSANGRVRAAWYDGFRLGQNEYHADRLERRRDRAADRWIRERERAANHRAADDMAATGTAPDGLRCAGTCGQPTTAGTCWSAGCRNYGRNNACVPMSQSELVAARNISHPPDWNDPAATGYSDGAADVWRTPIVPFAAQASAYRAAWKRGRAAAQTMAEPVAAGL